MELKVLIKMSQENLKKMEKKFSFRQKRLLKFSKKTNVRQQILYFFKI